MRAGVLAVGAIVAVVVGIGCHDANRVEVIRTTPAAPPRAFHWQLVPESAEVHDGVFASDTEAWVVGPYGTILHTTNGGATRGDWQTVASGTTVTLDAIAATGAFGLITGAGVALRYDGTAWSALADVNASGARPAINVGRDGKIEAWIATGDGFVYAADARTGGFAKADVPAGATRVVVSPTGDSWTLVPSSGDCVPYRRAHGQLDWHPAPTSWAQDAIGVRPIKLLQTRACATTSLAVTQRRKKLWVLVGDGVSEWDDARQAWTDYRFGPTTGAVPAGGVDDQVDAFATYTVVAQRTPAVVYRRDATAAGASRDPRERALAAWSQANATQFTAADVWMRGAEVWAAGGETFAHSRDGGQTWTSTTISEVVAPPAAADDAAPGIRPRARRPALGPSLRKIAMAADARTGWAVTEDGQLYRYDGAWHAADKLLGYPLVLSVADDGHAAWLMTRNALYQLDATQALVMRDDRMQALAMCPDGKHGWARYADFNWQGFDGTTWTKQAKRPALDCMSEACAAAIEAAAPSGQAVSASSSPAVCAASGQVWSIAQGETADGVTWHHPIAGMDAVQGRLAAVVADRAAAPTALIAVSPDGFLLRGTAPVDQPLVIDPRASADGTQVVLSWALSAPATAPVTWTIEHCAASACADHQWQTDPGVATQIVAGRYTAALDPARLSLVAGTKVDYRIRVAVGDLVRAPLEVAEVTLGESAAQAAWRTAQPYAIGLAAWLGVLLLLLLVWPRQLLAINDAARRILAQLPLLGGVAADLAGVVLARAVIRQPRVVAAWSRHALRAPRDGEAVADRPRGFAELADATTRTLYAGLPATQRAWVALHGPRAARTFEQSPLARERVAYGEAPALCDGEALTKGVRLETMRERIAPVAGDPKLVVWIRGPGGVGKSHLACRIARWAMTGVLGAPAIAIVLDENAESAEALKAAIRGKLAQATQATDIDDVVASALLGAGAVVPIFDGLTERSARTQDVVRAFLEDPAAPALAICTARAAHALTARRTLVLEPLALDGDELLPFLASFRASLDEPRPPEDLIEPVRRAARRIALAGRRTRLTPLLVTLLWDEAVAGGAMPGVAVDAFTAYVARALAPDGAAPDAGEQRRIALLRARALGRLGLGKDYRPGRWFSRDQAADQLRATGGSVDAFLAAGLLEARGHDDHELRFALDPLSEYLAALAILHGHDGNDAAWCTFVDSLDALPAEARRDADGFLLALADCFAAHGATLGLTRGPRTDDLPAIS